MTRRRAVPALLWLNLTLLGLWLGLSGRDAAPSGATGVRRSFAPPDEAEMSLHWLRQLPPPRPAWPEQPKMQFDAVYRPAVLGPLVFVGSTRTDSLIALDMATGEERWQFFTNGPIRFAPVVWQDMVYCTSDDGYLYCLEAASGKLRWKFRGGPSDRLILGNERLISTWPARGGPVVVDGVVYFAAGIWPFMGVFIHALDAQTGNVVWTTDSDGAVYTVQPHGADSFAGVAPQGSLVVAGDKLLVPSGRAVPACYDRFTGKQLHFRLGDSRSGGGSEVIARGSLFVNGGTVFDVATGRPAGMANSPALLTDNVLYSCNGSECQAFSTKSIADSKDRGYYGGSWTQLQRRILPTERVTAMAKEGPRLYAGGPGTVFAVDSFHSDRPTSIAWQAAMEGTPQHLLAVGGRLLVSTPEGKLYCFAPGNSKAQKHRSLPMPSPLPDEWTTKADSILKSTGVREGYCIVWGVGSGRLVAELARQSDLRIIVIEPDEARANSLRADLIGGGIYAERVAVHVARMEEVNLPPYLASLIVAEDLANVTVDQALIRKMYATLRPFGGIACLPLAEEQSLLVRQLAAGELVNGRVCNAASGVHLIREGPLPGSADWTHEHADAANTRVSTDQLVKAPLGLLWFGGPTHDGILPRHGHGPQPQVVDGRLIIEGPDLLRAIDIYTGRKLWETRLPGVGKDFDELWHQPGANASGTNYISTRDGIYVAYGSSGLRLDLASGKQIGQFRLPPLTPGPSPPRGEGSAVWSYINVADDYLVAGVNLGASSLRERHSSVSSSKFLVVMNRHTGKVLWKATAKNGFRHNAICIGGRRLYAIDRTSSDSAYAPWRRTSGEMATEENARLIAFDLTSGKELWSSRSGIFGTWLSYSAKHDVLVEAGRVGRDTLYDEAEGMRAWRADRGAVLWHQPRYSGPAMIRDDIILKDQSACHLLTGEPVLRTDPLTGRKSEWTWSRGYGCNTPAASQHLLTFRSGAAGFFDLANDGGTGNFGGFRSGCTNNLIVAGGVLTAPEYTRTCTCSYQNQSSLAMVPMPEAEMWTYFGQTEVTGVVRRVGINFGAPGNRRAPDGTLWLEWPRAGGPSPQLPVTITPANPNWFRRHSSWVKDGEPKWVAASGARGITSAIVTLVPPPSPYSFAPAVDPLGERERGYTVRLYFVEPDNTAPGERVFDVGLQGQTVLADFDIRKEAGGPARMIVKEFRGIKVRKELTVTLTPAGCAPASEPVLCGIEILAEGW